MSKEEFCADNIKAAVEKWVGPIEDMEAEFGKIDANGGGQVRFKNRSTFWGKKYDALDAIKMHLPAKKDTC